MPPPKPKELRPARKKSFHPNGNADDNYEGVSNAVEFVLGTQQVAGGFHQRWQPIIHLRARPGSIDASTSVAIEIGTDLATWPDTCSVGADTGGSSTALNL